MAKITALIHVHDEEIPGLGRALDSLRPCDQILVVNHDRDKKVERIASRHGAEALTGILGVSPGAYLVNAKYDWLLALRPSEMLSERLQNSLELWKHEGEHEDASAFSVSISEESGAGWRACTPETRLVNRKKVNWTGEIPPSHLKAPQLKGDLLRFRLKQAKKAA